MKEINKEYYWICKGLASYMKVLITEYHKIEDPNILELMKPWLNEMAELLDKYTRLYEQAFYEKWREHDEYPLRDSAGIAEAWQAYYDLFDNNEDVTDDDPESH